jgi:beta-lactam-binding protein with PASTA domain
MSEPGDGGAPGDGVGPSGADAGGSGRQPAGVETVAAVDGEARPPPGEPIAVGVHHLTKSFPGTRALVDVTMDVSPGPDSATIPNVVGFTQEAATTALQSAGFTVGTIQQVDDNAQQKGSVLSTEPAVGAVTPFSTPITLKVATGKVPVPDVRTKNFGVAQDTLQKAGLTSQIQQVDNATAAEGTVLDQTPAPSTVVDVGSSVTLKVARRPTAPPSTTTVTVTIPPTTPPPPPSTTTTTATTAPPAASATTSATTQ